jgi:hypothetical protein
MIAESWPLGANATLPISGCATTSDVLAMAERRGHVAVRIQYDGGYETLRKIGGEWVVTASR